MTKRSSDNIKPGLYRIFWKSGGNSLASVGIMHDGSRWFAPTNWTSQHNHNPLIASTNWKSVEAVKPLHIIETGEEIKIEEEEDPRCMCGHLHSEHHPVMSPNYSAGSCKVVDCKCRNFIITKEL